MSIAKKNKRGCYSYGGYFSFKVMAELHRELFPHDNAIDGGTKRAAAIFRALDRAYTDGIEDTAQMDDDGLRKLRKRISRKGDKDI